MPTYSRTSIIANTGTMLSGTISSTSAVICINNAVREVISDVDLRSTKRKSALSPNLFDGVYQYTCPSDLKGLAIIDISPQVKRGRLDQWRLTTEEEFDRLKEDDRVDTYGDPINTEMGQWLGEALVSISDDDFVRKILLSRPIDDKSITIDAMTSSTGWTAFGDGENITTDSSNYIKGSASVNWDISSAGGVTAGVYKAISSVDITEYLSEGSIFVWAYVTSATNLTNFIIRIGSSSTVYYTITITTNNEGTSFYAGWNLLRFSLANKVATGTVVDAACDYVALYMTKSGAKISETDYRFNNLVMAKGDHYDLKYYSKYGWQTSAGSYIENSTADTDLLNADTEEIKLIEYKAAELQERFLKNHSEGDRYFNLYTKKLLEYQLKYPSESLVSTTNYYQLNN